MASGSRRIILISFWISILTCDGDLIPYQRGSQTRSSPSGKVGFIEGTECPSRKEKWLVLRKGQLRNFLRRSHSSSTSVAVRCISGISFVSSNPSFAFTLRIMYDGSCTCHCGKLGQALVVEFSAMHRS
jgi:hypothetical protein